VQTTFELHYWHELDANAFGEIFEARAGTIRVRLLHARDLHDEFQSGEDGLPGKLVPDQVNPLA
jgi:hypothetical protein